MMSGWISLEEYADNVIISLRFETLDSRLAYPLALSILQVCHLFVGSN